ncbi:hypothetical protein [Rhodococcus sp. 114MFTsu3.1]|uniref:hypothetical protein n=1 Tax=Rhodococcus sp. 114MFTsu3.1 TaxID=1172184 RepID=UPI00036DC6BC|nr:MULTISPECIES: hypothetical protein [unclassified Rhodococcus (in: high G+C Gram-positive bacteria)]
MDHAAARSARFFQRECVFAGADVLEVPAGRADDRRVGIVDTTGIRTSLDAFFGF